MVVTADHVRSEVQNFLDYLIQSEIGLLTNPVVTYDGMLTWPTSSSRRAHGFLPHREMTLVRLYRYWIDTSAYSAVLADGALMQISYEFDRTGLVSHRLAYVRCPFAIEMGLLEREPIGDVLSIYAETVAVDDVRGGALRFDFDSAGARPGHPASHCTLIRDSCRIPCEGPMRLGRFAEFVFSNFYPRLWDAHPFLQRLAKSDLVPSTITNEDRRRVYISWS